jgi:rhodanese-related sulfurtransferase
MIGAREVMKLKESGRTVEVLDVRTPLEHAEIHAEGVRLVPLDTLDPKAVVQARNGTAEEPLYVICKSGKRAAQACEKFMEAGFTNVLCIDGGTEAWAAAGLPVVRGKTVISLERQVRIVAGLIVLISVVLGFTVHPWIFGVAGLVGAGLALAGATDFCGMGLLLARMPWNKRVGVTRCAS